MLLPKVIVLSLSVMILLNSCENVKVHSIEDVKHLQQAKSIEIEVDRNGLLSYFKVDNIKIDTSDNIIQVGIANSKYYLQKKNNSMIS